jgi:hypothetical protein
VLLLNLSDSRYDSWLENGDPDSAFNENDDWSGIPWAEGQGFVAVIINVLLGFALSCVLLFYIGHYVFDLSKVRVRHPVLFFRACHILSRTHISSARISFLIVCLS